MADLDARIRRVLEIMASWKRLGIADGWVSGFILSAPDAGGFELEAVLAKIRAQGKRVEESKSGRWGTTHYRLRD